jgi:AcrR family transcriptional regulator
MTGDQAGQLPASLAAAWGLRERPGKGPKPGLSLDQVVSAGLAVAEAEGLAAVSMSRVAAELGVGTMSLYRYVESKRDLLTLMMDVGLGPPPAAQPGQDWRAGLAGWATAQLAAFRRHLWAVQIPLSGPPMTPNALAWIEHALRAMQETGLTEQQKMSVILLISGFVRNEAMMEAQIDAAVRASGRTDQEAMASFGSLLRTLLDPGQFPELTVVADSGVMDKADDWDEEFGFGLTAILDGVESLVRAQSR